MGNDIEVLSILQEDLPEMKTCLALLKKDVELTKGYAKQNSRSLRGHNNTPGLVEEVRNLGEWKKNIKYWYVLLVGVIFTAVVVGIINIVLELGSRSIIP